MLKRLVLLALLSCCESARILGIFPMPYTSHMIINKALMMELAKRGHQVTVMSAKPLEHPIANYEDIVIPDLISVAKSSGENMDLFALHGQSVFAGNYYLIEKYGRNCESLLKHESVQRIIHSTNLTFDLLIYEQFYTDSFMGFAHKFDVPLIFVTSTPLMVWLADYFGNPFPFSYLPDHNLAYHHKMNFMKRLENTWYLLQNKYLRQYWHMPIQEKLMRKYFNYTENMPSLDEIGQKVSLSLTNGHFSINEPRPLVPAVIDVGGIHIQEPKQLPKEYKDFLDSATNGAVFFSLGSGLRSADLPSHKLNAFFYAFSKINQKVIWKFENDSLPENMPNVRTGKWFPQNDILAHPNIKLFITHGGLLGTQEALYHGVPIIGIPVFADQESNILRAESLGFGLKLDLDNITKESVMYCLNEILNNPSYKNRAEHHSNIFKDRPMKPSETAVYWVEYVLRHKGTRHMRSASLDLTWFQYFLFDVLTLSVVFISILIYCVYYIAKKLNIIFKQKYHNKTNKIKLKAT